MRRPRRLRGVQMQVRNASTPSSGVVAQRMHTAMVFLRIFRHLVAITGYVSMKNQKDSNAWDRHFCIWNNNAMIVIPQASYSSSISSNPTHASMTNDNSEDDLDTP